VIRMAYDLTKPGFPSLENPDVSRKVKTAKINRCTILSG